LEIWLTAKEPQLVASLLGEDECVRPYTSAVPVRTCPGGICPRHFGASTLKSCPYAVDVLMEEEFFT